MVSLTAGAVKEVKRMLQEQHPGEHDIGLRLGVKGGGCSGLSYALNFDRKHESDNEFVFEGIRVFVDPKSYLYLDGTSLDYVDTLQGKGFKFINPNAAKSCGCGESFSV
jgi:iron-sulfur cluster assembly protein